MNMRIHLSRPSLRRLIGRALWWFVGPLAQGDHDRRQAEALLPHGYQDLCEAEAARKAAARMVIWDLDLPPRDRTGA